MQTIDVDQGRGNRELRIVTNIDEINRYVKEVGVLSQGILKTAITKQLLICSRIDSTIREAVVPIDEVMDPNRVYYDDISGKVLDTKAVISARMEEIEGIKTFKVYDKVPRNEAYERTGRKPIAVRWVDVNKGDDINPEIRCRLVAKEINDHLSLIHI